MEKIEGIVRKHIKAGYEYEVFFHRIKKKKIEVQEERVENLSASEEVGVGIRVLKGNKLGFAYTTHIREEDIKDCLEKAIETCELQPPDEGFAFLEKLEPSSVSSVFDKEGVQKSLEEKINIPITMEKRAKEIDGRIKGVRKSSLSEGIFEVHQRNSYGLEINYSGTSYIAMISALAQDGSDASISWEYRGARRLSDIDVEDIVKDVVFKSTSLLNPSEFETKSIPVVLFRESAAMLLEAFSPMFLGDSLVKGKTLLSGKEEEAVGSEALTIIDNGSMDNGFATYPYDGEGVPTRRNVVIEKGVFKGFLHSLYTSRKLETSPTGNSERGGFRTQPATGITNLYVEKGDKSLEEMLSLPEVFLVIDLMGLHTADPISGEFSLGASGVLYREGKPYKTLRGVTVAGNILKLWNDIISVGEDLKFFANVGSPSILVDRLTVGGS